MEGLDQEMGQVIDESHRIGEQRPAAIDLQSPGGGSEGGERLILGIDHRAGESVEQCALAGIGVSSQGDEVKSLLSAPLSPPFAHRLHLFQLSSDLCHPPPDIMVHRLLIGSRPSKARLLSPLFNSELAFNLGGVIAQTGQLHLKLGLPGGSAGGEDLQNEIESVQHLGGKLAPDVEDLIGAERIVEYQLLWLQSQGLGYLPFPDLETMVPPPALSDLGKDTVSRSFCQAPQLFHLIGVFRPGRVLPQEQNCGLIPIHL